MSKQKISDNALFKAILVFIAVGALILGLRLFFHLPHFIGAVSDETNSSVLTHTSLHSTAGGNDIYIPTQQGHKRAPIHLNTHVK